MNILEKAARWWVRKTYKVTDCYYIGDAIGFIEGCPREWRNTKLKHAIISYPTDGILSKARNNLVIRVNKDMSGDVWMLHDNTHTAKMDWVHITTNNAEIEELKFAMWSAGARIDYDNTLPDADPELVLAYHKAMAGGYA